MLAEPLEEKPAEQYGGIDELGIDALLAAEHFVGGVDAALEDFRVGNLVIGLLPFLIGGGDVALEQERIDRFQIGIGRHLGHQLLKDDRLEIGAVSTRSTRTAMASALALVLMSSVAPVLAEGVEAILEHRHRGGGAVLGGLVFGKILRLPGDDGVK